MDLEFVYGCLGAVAFWVIFIGFFVMIWYLQDKTETPEERELRERAGQ